MKTPLLSISRNALATVITRLFLWTLLVATIAPARAADGVIYYNRIPSITSPAQVRRVNANGGGDQAVPLRLSSAVYPTVSRDGRSLLVTAPDPERPFKISNNVYLQDLTTDTAPRRLTSFDDVLTINGIILTNGLGQTNANQNVSINTIHAPYHKAFSPDGSQIVVMDLRRSGSAARTAPLTPGDSTQLNIGSERIPIVERYGVAGNQALGTYLYLSPQPRDGHNQGGDGVDWHPSVGAIVAALASDIPAESNAGINSMGGTILAALSPAGGGQFPRRLTNPVGAVHMVNGQLYYHGPNDYAPAFSPDGLQVAYARHVLRQYPDTGYLPMPAQCSIRVINSDGTGDREVFRLNDGLWLTKISWAPDGSALAFDVAPQIELGGRLALMGDVARSEIYAVNADGTNLRRLAVAPAAFPHWAPPGPFTPPPPVVPSVSPLQNNVPVDGLRGASGEARTFKISVPAGQSALNVHTLGGQGDCDLYIKLGQLPTSTSDADARSEGIDTTESITFSNPAAGDYFIAVVAYTNYSGVTLTAGYTQSATPPTPSNAPVSVRIITPVAGENYSSLPQASGTVSGQGVANVLLLLTRLNASNQITAIFDWERQQWGTSVVYRAAAGGASWHAPLPSPSFLTAGRYALLAEAADGEFNGMSEPVVATFTITTGPNPGPFPPLVTTSAVTGSFHGLFMDTVHARHESSGAFSLAVSSSRTYTGRFIVAGKRYTISGSFDSNGSARRTINRPGLPPLTMQMMIFPSAGNAMVTGIVHCAEWSADLVGHRMASNNAALAPLMGKYTLQFPGAEDALNGPIGHGYATVTVDARGNLRLTGGLADGALVVQSTRVVSEGYWPFYVPLYGGRGSALGWMRITADGARTIQGSVHWERPAITTSRLYPQGFNHDTQVTGAGYVTRGTAPVLELSTGTLTLTGPVIPDSLRLSIRRDANNRMVNSTNNATLLTINPATGLFRGAVLHPETGRIIPIKGAVNQTQNTAHGFFIDANQSGNVLLAQ